MSSLLCNTSTVTFGGPRPSPLSSPSSQSSPFHKHTLYKPAQATAHQIANSTELSNRFIRILQCFLSTPKAHSTLTHAEDNCLLNLISSRSHVPSGKGFMSHGLSGQALPPTRYGAICQPETFSVGMVRISLRSALVNIQLHLNTRPSCMNP